jgi:hypothetical protein
MANAKHDLEEIINSALRSTFVGKRLKVNRQRKARLCTDVCLEYCGDDMDFNLYAQFTFETGSVEYVLLDRVVTEVAE